MATIQVTANNLWNEIRFAMEGQEITRRLVPQVRDWETEIGMMSPVGEVLRWARVDDEIVVTAPGGDVVVKVLGFCS